jgi:hypothetical protein
LIKSNDKDKPSREKAFQSISAPHLWPQEPGAYPMAAEFLTRAIWGGLTAEFAKLIFRNFNLVVFT